MKIKYDIDDLDWENFVESHIDGNIFQTPDMFKVYEKTKKHEPVLIAAENNTGELIGVLLAVLQKEHSGILGNFSARSVIMGGPLIKNNDPQVLDLILKEYDKRIKGKAIYSQFRNFCDWKELKEIFKKNSFSYKENLNILIDLNDTEEEIFSRFSKSRRKVIRGALKREFHFSEGNEGDLENFYQLLELSYKRIGLPIPDIKYFYNLYSFLGRKCRLLLLKDEENDQIIVASIGVIYHKTFLAYYIGRTSDQTVLRKNPVDFFNWKRFQWAKENGIERFNWFGAGKPGIPSGVRDYKSTFGGELISDGRFLKIHKPFLEKFGKFLLLIWKKLR